MDSVEFPVWHRVFVGAGLAWVCFTIWLAVRNRKRLREKQADATFADVGVAVLSGDPTFGNTRSVLKGIFVVFAILLLLLYIGICVAALTRPAEDRPAEDEASDHNGAEAQPS